VCPCPGRPDHPLTSPPSHLSIYLSNPLTVSLSLFCCLGAQAAQTSPESLAALLAVPAFAAAAAGRTAPLPPPPAGIPTAASAAAARGVPGGKRAAAAAAAGAGPARAGRGFAGVVAGGFSLRRWALLLRPRGAGWSALRRCKW
jgi:hypothetical protein